MKELLYICRELYRGKSVLRAYLNLRLCEETLRGKTIDIGAGGGFIWLPEIKRTSDVIFENLDLKVGHNVDFEKDTLPAVDGFYDTVLFLNVMEHIFNYQHIANEVVRITKSDGKLIGYVPFLMWYHPDHHDFFRYTNESISKIFMLAGAKEVSVESIARGPGTAAAHMLIQSFPRLLRPILFLPFWVFDVVYRRLRSDRYKVFALGYFFIVKK